ncbi:hypothetical protein J5X98_10265 [Leptothermofonsia sichuanensis E412]|uniref:hypothetical protein n=1 Tax=Leptothermofonsia sichuanensis TaxID=2917832 RepID=UPI001CA78790|nr:hypothetical protein [Leptothermofonsia sichuanensis]QZZ22702.1 hypothetical protein J5X98_10265 [Leptothermofonsia sichuanensis E412]
MSQLFQMHQINSRELCDHIPELTGQFSLQAGLPSSTLSANIALLPKSPNSILNLSQSEAFKEAGGRGEEYSDSHTG